MSSELNKNDALASFDVFSQTPADIPEGSICLESVRNRPVVFYVAGFAGLALLGLIIPAGLPVILALAFIYTALIFVVVKDTPVLDFYQGFIVCHKTDDPAHICIINDEGLIAWTLSQHNTSVIQLFYADPNNVDNAICAHVHTLNSYGVTHALEKRYGQKNQQQIQRAMRQNKS